MKEEKRERAEEKPGLSRKEYEEVLNMVLNRKTDWGVVFDLFHHGGISVDSFLMGPDFFEIARECYNRQYPNIIFSDFPLDTPFHLSATVLGIKDGCAKS